MKITGIIAEYNPFHKGHEYQLIRARELTGADFIVVVMSGDYVQRGQPAILDKFKRTQMALAGGADLVLELPVCYAASSAPDFAFGAVHLLDKLGCVDFLCFGSESGDLTYLRACADLMAKEELYQPVLKEKLREGLSFPAAREAAMTALGMDACTSSPNDILGVSYLQALRNTSGNMTPIPVQRRGAGYNDPHLHTELSSATAIRRSLYSITGIPGGNAPVRSGLQDILVTLPEGSAPVLRNALDENSLLAPDVISPFLHYKLLQEPDSDYTSYLDVSRELSDRISNQLENYRDFTSFCRLLKTKELTYSRISRCLLHIFLDLKQSHRQLYFQPEGISYARVLGFRKDALSLLSEIGTHARIPLISKLADYYRGKKAAELSSVGQKMLAMDVHAAELYQMLLFHQNGVFPIPEQRRQIIRYPS